MTNYQKSVQNGLTTVEWDLAAGDDAQPLQITEPAYLQVQGAEVAAAVVDIQGSLRGSNWGRIYSTTGDVLEVGDSSIRQFDTVGFIRPKVLWGSAPVKVQVSFQSPQHEG